MSEVVKDFLFDFCRGKLHSVCSGCTRGSSLWQASSDHDCVQDSMKCVRLILDDIDQYAFNNAIDGSSRYIRMDFDKILSPATFITMLGLMKE